MVTTGGEHGKAGVASLRADGEGGRTGLSKKSGVEVEG